MTNYSRPSDQEIDEKVSLLRDRPVLVYCATTGAAGRLTQDLCAVPGASKNVVGTDFLYDKSRTDDFLGFAPKSYCAMLTGCQMAAEAFARARRVGETDVSGGKKALGLGMTCAIATSRELRGGERAYIAARTEEAFVTAEVRFPKGELTRREQGELCDMLALNLVLSATGVEAFPWERFGVGVGIETVSIAEDGIAEANADEAVIVHDNGTREKFFAGHVAALDPAGDLVFPGSFAPLHGGHEAMAALAARMTGRRVIYQITSRHPVKGDVPKEELARRVGQFRFHRPVLVSSGGSLYIEKARMLPGLPFLIGVDAVIGLLDPKYYDGREGLLDVLAEFDRIGTRFYVVGRRIGERFVTLDEVPIPPKFSHLFVAVSGRWDVSSTELRAKGR